MRIILPVVLIFSTLWCTAQDDEFRDFRNKKDNYIKAPKELRADLASFTMAGIDESITKLPLSQVPVKAYGNDYMTYKNDKIEVTIKTARFEESKHKLMLEGKHVVKIDGKPFYGILGASPGTQIQSITVVIGKDTVAIPPTAYFDLYEPGFFYSDKSGSKTRNGVFLSGDGNTIYIYMLNTENKGTEYTWIIQNKAYLRRVVDFDLLK